MQRADILRSEKRWAWCCLGLAGIGLAMVVAAAGCSARPARTAPGAVAHAGGSWDVVFSGPAIAAAGEWAGPELSRLDGRMNRDDSSVYPLDSWPDEPRPSLFRPRRITVPTTPESVQFFGTAGRDTWYDAYWYRY